MIRNLSLLCAALFFGIISAYTLVSREPRADFTYVNPSGIHTLDPARMSWTQDFRVALNIWEGLTTWHPQTTEPIEGAALFPPDISSDGLTYTFTIRENACWSNGDPVSAQDFLRGWRRGMEPGTATDYTYLFTDHIAGATEYVRWRRRAVGALTTLDRLSDGWSINARQARAIARHPVFERIRAGANGRLVIPGSEDDGAAWDRTAHHLSNMSADWKSFYDQVLQTHAAELDTRFDRVGVDAPDDRTLAVRLTRPCPYFLDLTAFPIFLPCHESIELLREHHRDAPITAEGLVVYDPQWTKPDYHRNNYPGLVTNGPYRLTEWTFKRRARLTVNAYHRAAETIGCRSVDMLVYENINAAIMAYEAGDVDFLPAMDVPYDHEIARLARSGERPDYHLCHVLATYFLNFNCVSETVGGHPNPFIDHRVRKAFSLAVDKETIVENVLK
ncbi:MAG: ABC transporter substrate-binding protein, partial [Phycisphaerae bacterium]